MDTRLNVLTQGALVKLHTCEELFRLRYIERLVKPGVKPALSLGSAVHKGLETGDPDAAAEHLRTMRGPAYSQEDADALTRDIGVVRGMTIGAVRLWGCRSQVRREVPFRLPLRNPTTGSRSTAHDFAGIWDGVDTGAGMLEELKTTSRLDRDYIARLDIDFQVTSYLAAASFLLGKPFLSMRYLMIRKPSIRQTQKETPDGYAERVEQDYADRPDFYFAETTVTRTAEDIERWQHEVWAMHQRVLEIERGAFPIRNTRACLDFGRCDYFDLCTRAVDVSSFDVLDNPYPELAEKESP